MALNHTQIVEALWSRIRASIDDKIASASEHAKDAQEAKEYLEQLIEDGNIGGGAPEEHEHDSVDIRDAVSQAGTSAQADRVMKTDSNGRFRYLSDPVDDDEIVNAGYVKDSQPWIGTRSEYNAITNYLDKLYVIVT